MKKGDKIYYAITDLDCDEKLKIQYMAVIERTLDSIGRKRMTFQDHGFDWIYCKSVRADYPNYHPTREAAERWLRERAERDLKQQCPEYKFVIIPGAWDDRSRTVFDTLHAMMESSNGAITPTNSPPREGQRKGD